MSSVESIFPNEPPSSTPVVDAPRVIDAVGVEVLEVNVLDDVLQSDPTNLKEPANRNDVIPFAATLRRVG